MSLADDLRRCSHLADLDAREIESLAQAMQVIDAADGHVFIEEGRRSDGVFLVVDGTVRITHETEGRATEIARIGRGDLFGLVGLIDHGPRTATCSAAGPARVAWLPSQAFLLLSEGSPSLVLHFQTLVARQLARDARALNDALVRAMVTQHRTGQGEFSGEFHVTVAR